MSKLKRHFQTLRHVMEVAVTFLPSLILGLAAGAWIAHTVHAYSGIHGLSLAVGLLVVGSGISLLAGLWLSRDGKEYLGRTDWVVAVYIIVTIASAIALGR